MTVPREAMRLTGDPEAPHLVGIRSGTDHTQRMHEWAEQRIDLLEKERLCGYVFKSKSPSSGLHQVKVYNEHGIPRKIGRGLFAARFVERFPLLPCEEDGRLHDPRIRENFIEQVFVYQRWLAVTESLTPKTLGDFHARHKLLIMARSPENLRALGRIVAGATKKTLDADAREYLALLMKTLALQSTVKKNVNVLHHILGYFKKTLSPDEKQESLEIIEEYHRYLVPLVVPVTLLRHYVRKYDEPYLREQVYLHPHPAELMLRNHV
jgi:uncharacterized protein YbgA (DUF1722 family)